MSTIFKRVFDTLPKEYRVQAVIAGGAAACLQTAKDIDLFILRINDGDKAEELRTALIKAKIPGIEFRSGDPIVPDPEEVQTDSCVDGRFNVLADVMGSSILPIQIIGSPFMTVEDLLHDFDISTHCVAFTEDGVRHTIPETTGLLESPKVVHANIPDISISRYRRICKRYGVTPLAEELLKLCNQPDPMPKGEWEAEDIFGPDGN